MPIQTATKAWIPQLKSSQKDSLGAKTSVKQELYYESFVGPTYAYDPVTHGAKLGMERQNILETNSPYAFPPPTPMSINPPEGQ